MGCTTGVVIINRAKPIVISIFRLQKYNLFLKPQKKYTPPKKCFFQFDLGWKFGNDDDNPWKMGVGEYLLPVFYWQTTAMPKHLK